MLTHPYQHAYMPAHNLNTVYNIKNTGMIFGISDVDQLIN